MPARTTHRSHHLLSLLHPLLPLPLPLPLLLLLFLRPLLVLSLLLPLSASAQLVDSLGHFLHLRPRWTVGVDTRGSFISNRGVSVAGVRVGLEHGGRLRYGLGYQFLLTQVERDRPVWEDGAERVVPTRLRLGYVAPYISYTFLQRRRWSMAIPVQVGVGRGSLLYEDLDGDRRPLQRTTLWVYEPLMTVQYRFWRYAAFQFGWGYRLVARSKGLDEQLTAPIYQLGLRLFTREVVEDLRK